MRKLHRRESYVVFNESIFLLVLVEENQLFYLSLIVYSIIYRQNWVCLLHPPVMCSKNPDEAKDTSGKPYNSCSLITNLTYDYNNANQ